MPDTSSTDTKPEFKKLTRRIAKLREASIRLNQSHHDGKLIMGTESMGQLCSLLASMMEDLEKRVFRLEATANIRN